MQTGAVTPYIDVAQLTLYAFWLFFLGLVIYLILENKREGFPLITSRPGERLDGILPMPSPKTFLLRDGTTRTVPSIEPDEIVNAAQEYAYEGAPWVPLGDPMQDGVGPASFALRAMEPELNYHGEHRTVPLRVADDHWVAEEDSDPRGWDVVTLDGLTAGTVADLWIDRTELQVRFYEVAPPDPLARHVLVPAELVQVVALDLGGIVKVICVTAGQLAAAPVTASTDFITLREEDRISAYFGSGHMYATESRFGPLI